MYQHMCRIKRDRLTNNVCYDLLRRSNHKKRGRRAIQSNAVIIQGTMDQSDSIASFIT